MLQIQSYAGPSLIVRGPATDRDGAWPIWGKSPMKLSGVVLAAACIAMLPVTGHAQPSPTSANQVMQGCRAFLAWKWDRAESRDDTFLSGACVGIVSALGAAATDSELSIKGTTGVCVPEGVTMGQQVRVVVTYIDARPNRLHENFYVLTMEALRDAWPCKG